MNIGLYTLHATNNVGAMLQTFALTKVLQRNGHVVEVVNVYTKDTELRNHHKSKGSIVHNIARMIFRLLHSDISKMEQEFDDFHSKLPLSKRFYSYEEYIKAPNSYDLHLVGSDQVWNLQKGYEYARFFLLDYINNSSKKKSYASSFGTTELVKDVEKVKDALASFDTISVREDTAVRFVQNALNRESEQTVDPTLLFTAEEWDQYIEREPIVQGRYVLYYGVNRDNNVWSILCEAKRRLNAKIVGIPGILPPQYKFDEYIYSCGPLQFVNIVKHAEFVITSSFHGLAFAVNYNKPFVLVKYGERMERMDSLVRLLGAESRIAETKNDLLRIIDKKLDGNIQISLQSARLKSLRWINDNIVNQKQ